VLRIGELFLLLFGHVFVEALDLQLPVDALLLEPPRLLLLALALLALSLLLLLFPPSFLVFSALALSFQFLPLLLLS